MKGTNLNWGRRAFAGLSGALLGAACLAGAQGTVTPPVLRPNVVLQPILPRGDLSLLVVPEDGAVSLVWPVSGDPHVVGYDVYSGGQKVNAEPIRPGQGRAVGQYRVGGLKNGGQYEFRVVAVGSGGAAVANLASAVVAGRPVVCDRYAVKGSDMGPLFQNIQVGRGPATVTVNGTGIPAGSGLYQGQLPAAVPVGGTLNLLTTVGDCVVFATDRVPERPALTAPAAGSNVVVSSALPVSWTSGSNPDRFVVSASWLLTPTSGTGWRSDDLPGSARSFSIPAGTLPAGKTVKVRVYAYNDGKETFVGSFTPDSRMAIRGGDEAGRDVLTAAPSGPTNPPAVSWGDPHLMTFDQTAVEFQSVGEFDLAQSTSGSEFRVQARQRPWGGSSVVSVNAAVATRLSGQKVGVYAGVGLRVGNAGTVTPVPAGGLDFGGGYRVTQAGNVYTFDYPGGERLTLTDNGGYVDARASMPDARRGQVRGLWGNFDGNTTNDLFLRSGAPLASPVTFTDFYGPYANSWRVPSPAESLFVYDGSDRFGGFDNPAFPSAAPAPTPDARSAAEATCRAAGITDAILLEKCITDVATTGQPGFATSTAATQRPRDQVIITAPGGVDLIVTGASATFSGMCRPYAAFITARVTVKNVGSAASVARSDVGLAQVIDARDEGAGTGGRGNGVGLPSIPAGGSVTVDIPVYYPITTPEDTVGTRTYTARVNAGNWIPESNTANNRFGTPVTVTIPAGACRNRVALLHGADTGAAGVLKAQLHDKGLLVTPVNAAAPVRPDVLSAFDLLMIDPLTGDAGTWNGSPETLRAAVASRKPMLGLGGGGYAFFGKLSYRLGWDRGASGTTGVSTLQAGSPVHPVLNSPFATGIGGGPLGITTAGVRVVAYPSSLGVERQAILPVNTDYAVLAGDPSTNTGMWGYYGVPNLTDAGWKTLANQVWYMLR